jgi:DNA-binding NarL/FixJ family response regulator
VKPRAVIVDDHLLFAEAFARFVEPTCDVMGIYPDARVFLEEAVSLKPDIVFLDVSMPHMNGLDAARALRELVPKARIIIVTMSEDPDIAAEAFRRGADGYLLKSSEPSELRSAIRDVLNHRTYITRLLKPALARPRKPRSRARPSRHLTDRQRQVLKLLAQGHSMKEVGVLLQLSPRTVAFHKYRLMEHLHVHSSAELIRFAVREGLV